MSNFSIFSTFYFCRKKSGKNFIYSNPIVELTFFLTQCSTWVKIPEIFLKVENPFLLFLEIPACTQQFSSSLGKQIFFFYIRKRQFTRDGKTKRRRAKKKTRARVRISTSPRLYSA